MNGRNADGDEPGTSEADQSPAEWVAEMTDRISAGESLDLDALALEFPDGVERVRRIIPAMAVMARLGAPSGADVGETSGNSSLVAGVKPGGFLGDFRMVRVIGRGGMGVVYDAVQASLNRRVALKILPVGSAGDSRKLKRFKIEAQAAACLHHPHIVPVYLVGSDGEAHYYAMQFIEGRTLAELLTEFRRRAAVMPAAARHASGQEPSPRFAAELARALHYAHEQGIVHRDVKPSNLLVEDTGWLWVADFGLARMKGESDLTTTGALMGTLRYMSPEQVLGPPAVVDHRADVYALGATLYELMTLRPAFEGDDRFELLRMIAVQEPRPPRRIDPAIPRDLETIVLKAMAKDATNRYATAKELAEDLGRFLQNRTILARPPTAVDRAGKWMRRHKSAVAAAAVALLAAVTGLGGAVLWRDGVLRGHNSELRLALGRTEENESATRRLWYDSQMRLAQQSTSSGQVELAQEVLEALRPDSPGRDLRGFEWHYLRRLCHRDVSILTDHETTSMIVSPDGRILVSGDGYGSLVIWDLAANRERKRFQGHPREVSGLMSSSDGGTLASWSTVEGTPSEVKLWDPGTGRLLASIPGIKGYVASLAFSPDGRMLVILEHDANGDSSKNMAVRWSLAQGPEHPVPGAAPILCDKIAYSPDGRWLATGMLAGSTVTLRDAATGQQMTTLATDSQRSAASHFLPTATPLPRIRGESRFGIRASGASLVPFRFIWRAMPRSLLMEIGSPESRILARRSSRSRTSELILGWFRWKISAERTSTWPSRQTGKRWPAAESASPRLSGTHPRDGSWQSSPPRRGVWDA